MKKLSTPLLKQQIWTILNTERENKLRKIISAIKARRLIRLGDILVLSGMVGLFLIPCAILKNVSLDSFATTPDTGNKWFLYMSNPNNKMYKFPFMRAPDQSEFRDLELYNRFYSRIESMTGKKVNEINTTLTHSHNSSCVIYNFTFSSGKKSFLLV